ncbi:hypothetical protein M2G95_21545 [Vibrio vulnificus]|nr:hypothetical protein [Vibrio vulnificus]MCU8181795.1 hypothetical protein [Vibrio vulnificus]MCU8304554.1 hypothetical protein [Vibrio vulnificus]
MILVVKVVCGNLV